MIASAWAKRGRIAKAVPLALIFIVVSVFPQTYVEDTTGSKWAGWAAGGVLPCLLALWLAPKVSYRRRHALWFLFAGYTIVVPGYWVREICWRIAYLPRRDWPARADEVPLPGQPGPEPPPAPVVVPGPPKPKLPAWARDVTELDA